MFLNTKDGEPPKTGLISCDECGKMLSKVMDSRPRKSGRLAYRRRECLGCGFRYTTYEIKAASVADIPEKIIGMILDVLNKQIRDNTSASMREIIINDGLNFKHPGLDQKGDGE